MKSGLPTLAVWTAALWWGALTIVGFLVVPMLFANLPTPAIAGAMAARLFSALTWVAVGCGLVLLVILESNQRVAHIDKAHSAMVFVIFGMLLALLSEFAVAPRIMARQDLRLWHSVGTTMYVLQWLCASVTFWKLTASKIKA